MKIVALFFPHFPLQVELGADPGLRGAPVIIGGFPNERKPVIDAFPEAERSGVGPGMPLRQAYGLCPEAVFLPARESRYRERFESVLDLLGDFGPMVEGDGLGLAFVGIPSPWEAPEFIREVRAAVGETGFAALVGCAANKFVAGVAARTAQPSGIAMVPCGRERDFLRDLPIGFLPASEGVMRQLERLGIRTLGQVQEMPPGAMGLVFGMEGERLWQLARGLDERPIVPRRRAERLFGEVDLDPPAEDLEWLLGGIERVGRRLAPALGGRGLCCRRITIALRYADGGSEGMEIPLKRPAGALADLLEHCRVRLAGARLRGPVSGIGLVLSDLGGERGDQLALVSRPPRSEGVIRELAEGLRRRYGKPMLHRVVLTDGRGSRLPERRFSLVSVE